MHHVLILEFVNILLFYILENQNVKLKNKVKIVNRSRRNLDFCQ